MQTTIKTNYTPGPWTVGPRNRIQAGCLVLIGEGEITARPMNDHYATKTEQNFNARLIAAAPDLLKACKYAESHLGPSAPDDGEHCWEALQMLTDAIRKAEGTP